MAYDDDDDEGPGFLTTAVLLTLAAGGAWFIWRTLTSSAAAATPEGTTGTTGGGIASGLNLSSLVGSVLPRGVRNNNPGNIKYNVNNQWDGQTGQDANGFAVFSAPVYGLRAMFLLLRNYSLELSPFSVDQIAARWTSGDPSATQSVWASTVASVAGVDETAALDPSDAATMAAIVNGIITAENGGAYVALYASDVGQAQQLAA